MGKMALDRSQWRKLINGGIEYFENTCFQYAIHKRSVRKSEQGPAPDSQSHHINWEIYEKLCLSFAGLKSQMQKYTQLAAPHHDIHVSKNDPQPMKKFPQFGRLEKSSASAYNLKKCWRKEERNRKTE